eukprot:TRINITY_DN22919_c1_g1_i3.p1 TRINITY_DN22919_c1_g1~~TRINITY_DN22919_c1_g1_i3.p1  ORF type:complete len:1039 (-),score=295.60 TRINITY_DN22919_c1_g1_i3:106-3156(-)
MEPRSVSMLPPWWIQHGVKPAGPEKDNGSWKAVTFSREQQVKFGVDASGTVTDQAKFDRALRDLKASEDNSLRMIRPPSGPQVRGAAEGDSGERLRMMLRPPERSSTTAPAPAAASPEDGWKCRSCGNTGIDFLGNPCACGKQPQAAAPRSGSTTRALPSGSVNGQSGGERRGLSPSRTASFGAAREPSNGGNGGTRTFNIASPQSSAKQEGHVVRTLSERQAEWNRADEDQNKLFDCQWKIITEQMQQISALVDGMAILRQEVQMLKGDTSERLDTIHDKLGVCITHDHHASMRERIDYLEKFVGESADKHSAELEAAHKRLSDCHERVDQETEARGQHHATMEERLKYIEKFLGDSADQHSKNFDALTGKVRDFDSLFHSEREAREEHSRTIMERLDQLETLLGESTAKHGEGLDVAHQKLEQAFGRHATFDERIAYLEKAVGDSAESHLRHEQELAAAHQLLQDVHGKVNDERQAREEVHGAHRQQLDELVGALGVHADKHSSELDTWKQQVQDIQLRIADEQGARDTHHANFEQRISFLEKCVGDSADRHGEHSNDLEQLRRMVEDEKLSRDKHYDTHKQWLEELEKRAAELDANHGSHANVLEQFHGNHSTLQERVQYIEKMLGDSADAHKEHAAAVDDAKGQLKDMHEKLRVHAEARESHHANVNERLDYIEALMGDSADKHAQEIERAHQRLEALQGHIDSHAAQLGSQAEVARDEHHQRLEKLEKHMEDSSDLHNGHARELENADRRLVDLHGYIKCEKQEREELHGTMKERLDYLERVIGDSFDKHSKELQDTKGSLQEAHQSLGKMREERDQHHATMEQRIAYAEAILGDSADRYIEKAELEALCQHIDEIRGHVKNESSRSSDRHVTLENRVEFLEAKVCDSMGKYSSELDIVSQIRKQQASLHERVSAVSKDLHDMEGTSMLGEDVTYTPDASMASGRLGGLGTGAQPRRPVGLPSEPRAGTGMGQTPGRTGGGVFSTPTGPAARSQSPQITTSPPPGARRFAA